ncbi:hypothetical protein ACTNDZ_14450 [Selenomonas montiformis]|uniref:hypothetical protein n=1 Tax=Selenomonas montiformis TaxID=2652285 RepID=UPI003F8B7B5E
MKIYVAVPHDIIIVAGAEFAPAIRKYIGGEVIKTLSSDGVLNAKIETKLSSTEDGIPVFEKAVVGCDPYPEGYDVVVVSALYASAYRKLHGDVPASMRLVADPVMSDDGKTFRGCCGLALPF